MYDRLTQDLVYALCLSCGEYLPWDHPLAEKWKVQHSPSLDVPRGTFWGGFKGVICRPEETGALLKVADPWIR
ncbi:hypothetical protein CMI37_17715, partial [Candidatus Pacearchaeota archaeon]|nr:hypothetical protein [Candidatus Pacearchaeota archaeon]